MPSDKPQPIYLRVLPCGECDDPNCGEGDTSDASSEVAALRASLHDVIGPAKRILARLHNEPDTIQGDDVMALEAAIERGERYV